MSTTMTKFDFNAKYGHLEFYDNRNRKHVLTYNCLLDVVYSNAGSVSKTAADLELPDLLADYNTASRYENAYRTCVEKTLKAHERVVNAKIKQPGKTKLKRSDFTACQYSRDVDVGTVLDMCRVLDELVKKGTVITSSLQDGHTLTVRYTVNGAVGIFSMPVGAWINIVRASNPAFHFLPFITN